jgi:hypothetical protein
VETKQTIGETRADPYSQIGTLGRKKYNQFSMNLPPGTFHNFSLKLSNEPFRKLKGFL